MNEAVLTLVAHHGATILFVMTLLSSLALPVPASFALLAAGAFAASGDLRLELVGVSALAGAGLGDLTGYGVGRVGGADLWAGLARRPKIGKMMMDARDMLHAHAARSVLLSRWPFSPLGPYVNFASGATRLPVGRFAVLCVLGDAVWISLYLGLGYAFAARFKDLGEVLSLFVGALAIGAVTAFLIRTLRRRASPA